MQAILFVCSYNSVRSPMAAALLSHLSHKPFYVQSAGIELKDIDGYAIAVLKEEGLDISHHQGQVLANIRDRNFDKVIALSEAAYSAAQKWIGSYAIDLEYWNIDEPIYSPKREETLASFRHIRNELKTQIQKEILEIF
ncbi:MAG: low molecular weight phosphatase family protein [Alphaproteobacteria bacterium]